MPDLVSPLRSLLGGKTATALEAGLGLRTLGDLVQHYPRRYQRRGELTDLAALQVGEQATIVAEVQSVRVRKLDRRRSMTDVVVSDGRRELTLTFFNQPWLTKKLHKGVRASFDGNVDVFNRRIKLTNPEFEPLEDDEDGSALAKDFAGQLVPIYPSSAKARTKTVRRSVRLVLPHVGSLADPLPPALRARHHLVDRSTALHDVHFPDSLADAEAARRRLKWDEAMALQVTLAQRRRAAAENPATPRPARPGGLLESFEARLPFALTGQQEDIGALLQEELAGRHPMHRLLQGEVGSGKTVVALRAMLQVVDSGGQAALLAPTEVLAAQHGRSLRELLGPLAHAGELESAESATRVALLTGSQSATARRAALAEVASGEAGIVVGTHALLQETVQFRDLGLVVIDEQHRFGVEQRDALRAKGADPPHVLVMTATPIPRTVAMTVYGDLEVSLLRELPSGRVAIESHVVPSAEHPSWLDKVWQRVREHVERGHQAFVVCPRIGDGDESTYEVDPETGTAVFGDGEQGRRPPVAVTDVYPMLTEGPLAGLRVEMLHGRMGADDKDAVMRQFTGGEIDVLVATTVIEVGVDVPNATVMVVMDAERFGVSQLHQLRGRIGRGTAAGLCLLVTEAPEGSTARERVDAVAKTLDGFKLARVDLEQRREGDVLGARQAGRKSQLRLLSLLRDEDVITEAREEATALVKEDPALKSYPALAAAVAELVADEQAEYLEKA